MDNLMVGLIMWITYGSSCHLDNLMVVLVIVDNLMVGLVIWIT